MQQGDGAPNLTEIAAGYREMSDAEMTEVARGYDGLIEPVQALVRAEFARRGLEPPLVEEVGLRQLVTVDRFLNLTEASLAQGVLESAGIESFLRDTNIVRNDWFYSNAIGGIRLEVDAKDLEAAKELLSQPIPDLIAAEDWDSYKQPSCPKCHSTHLLFQKEEGGVDWERSLLADYPLHKPSRYRWRCADCGYEWTDDGLPNDVASAPVG